MNRRELLLVGRAGPAIMLAPIVVSVRVLFDAGARSGRGLVANDCGKFLHHQEVARREFAASGIHFQVEYISGAYLRTQGYSEIPDQFLALGRINVFVSDTLRLDVDSQRTGGASVGPWPSRPGVSGNRFYKTFFGLREAGGNTLGHEYAHHLARDTTESPSTTGNLWADFRNDYWLWRQRRGAAIEGFRVCADLPWAKTGKRVSTHRHERG